MTNRALITGINGQDGSYLAELLVSRGYEVFGIVRPDVDVDLSNLESIKGKITVQGWGIQNGPDIIPMLERYKPTEVYNLASISFSPACEANPILAGTINGLNAVRIMEGIKQYDPKIRMFQASSSEMYGIPTVTPQDEYTTFNPITVYGISKLYAHQMASYYSSKGLYISCGILYSHDSPRRKPEFVVRKLCRAAARISRGLDTLVELGNLDSVRDWSYAPDIVEGMWAMLQQPNPSDFILASGVLHTVRDVCEVAFRYVGLDYRNHVRVKYNLSGPNIGGVVGNIAKAGYVMGWRPTVNFETMIKIMVEADLKLIGGKGG